MAGAPSGSANGGQVKLTVEVKGRVLHALSADEVEAAAGSALVLDLRKVHELPPGDPWEGLPRIRVPITSESLSEQDMDHIRRELVRTPEPVALLSTGGRRAATVALMHAGRTLGWSVEETLAKCPALREEPGLERWLTSYLQRHASAEYHEEQQ